MEGVINSLVYLTNENSVELLKKYIFKIIPMFNVDGVIYGNSRCDISGSDTNRKWTPKPNSFLYPVTHHSKKLFSQLINEGYDIEYFIDLHGHSKKLGTFVYACKTMDQVETRMLSWLMGKVCNKFAWENCIFGLAKTKAETARGSMAQLVQGKKAITLETSFFGWKKFGGPPKHFDTKDLHEIGENLLTSIYIEQGRDPKLYNWGNIRNEIRSNIENSQAKEDDYESGSDSCPSEDEMTFEEKASSFLPSTVATKIGLVEIKVVEKSRPRERLPIVERGPPEDQTNAFGGFEHPQTDSLASLEPSPFQSYFSNKLSSSTLPKSLPHSKSVTKVSPFKFTERNRQSFSTKKIRIAIDVRFVQENKQKMSVPSLLPQIQQSSRKQGSKKKKNFWVDFHHEYEKLVKEKEKLVLEKDLNKNVSAKDVSKPLLGIKAYK